MKGSETLKDIAAWTVVIVFCPIWLPIKLVKDVVPRRRRRCANTEAREALERLQEERRKDYEEYLKVNTPKPFNSRRRAISHNRSRVTPNAQSQFLKCLPPEIRTQIYEYVLGGQVFHLVAVPRRIAHVRCDRSFEGDAVHANSDLFDATRKCFPHCRNRFSPSSPVYDHSHQSQGEVWRRYGPMILNSLSTSNLALLRACHQMYHEASHILYRNNVFDFDNILTFLNFAINISPDRLAMIRHLQIRSEFHNCRLHSSWSYYIAPPFMRNNYLHETWEQAWLLIATSMASLTHLSLFVDSSGFSTPKNVNERWLHPILMVRGLKKFELVVRENGKYLDPIVDKDLRQLTKRLRVKMYAKREVDAKTEKEEKELKVELEKDGGIVPVVGQDSDAIMPVSMPSTMSGAI